MRVNRKIRNRASYETWNDVPASAVVLDKEGDIWIKSRCCRYGVAIFCSASADDDEIQKNVVVHVYGADTEGTTDPANHAPFELMPNAIFTLDPPIDELQRR